MSRQRKKKAFYQMELFLFGTTIYVLKIIFMLFNEILNRLKVYNDYA
jgi:hypothetical protein